ncbi:MAG: PLD nuclease N-terminal domain-containing protein [Armatimonadetes bacterium]|nr:PLD nuclease N-terminal domain-containing protein [Armatimonadota bacterium]
MWDLITLPFRLVSGLLGILIWIIIFALWVYCVYDCATRRFRDPNHKWIWLAVLLVSFPLGLSWLSAILYLIFGRQQAYGR